jgi:AmpD protein
MTIRDKPKLDWLIDEHGWLSTARRVPSQNCDDRPLGTAIDLVIVHAISLPPGEFGGNAVEAFFTNRLDPEAHPYFRSIFSQRVSAHFFIRRDGSIVQFVSCLQRAWHAGMSCWRGRERCNDFSLGIELEGDDHTDYSAGQYASLSRLIAALRERFGLQAIVGHADVAPGRKTDPGSHFDWPRIG